MLGYGFMQNAFAAAAIVAVVAGAVGYFLVARSQTFAGHALSHVGFAGATGAILIGASPFWGLIVFTVGASLLMGLLGERLNGRDVAIGIVLSLALGFGILFLHYFTAFASQATALLFGNVYGVDRGILGILLGLGVLSLAALGLIARPLLFSTVQPELAEAKGVPLRLVSMIFLAIVAVAVAECTQVVGVLLVFSLMVGPAAAAQRLTGKVGVGVVLSAVLALVEAWAGLVLSYYSDWPASFCITALSAAVFFLTMLPVVARGGASAPQHSH
jgi:zinc/manganese transport system permease protein